MRQFYQHFEYLQDNPFNFFSNLFINMILKDCQNFHIYIKILLYTVLLLNHYQEVIKFSENFHHQKTHILNYFIQVPLIIQLYILILLCLF